MKSFVLAVLLTFSSLSFAVPPKDSTLPKIFAGWQQQSVSVSSDPSKADALNADLLKEDAFSKVETAEYTKPDRSLSIKVAHFADASGAYAAFLFYRASQMAQEDIADQAASNNQRVLFRKANLLVDAKFDRITPMSGGELRELASDLTALTGNSARPPDITRYLPKQGIVENSVKYVSGPIGLARTDSPLSSDLIDFSTSPEVASALYNTGEGTALLTLISYPTPAIAGNRLRAIEGWHPTPAVGSTTVPAVFSKRTGPYVVVLSGTISQGEAKTLLASVNYDPEVTWNENTHFDRNNNLGSLLVNIIILIAIITGLAIVAGFAFGGVRIVAKRLFPDRVFDRPQDADIIRLNIGK